MEKERPVVTVSRGEQWYQYRMLVGKIWGDKLPPVASRKETAPVGRIGLGGSLETTTEKGRRLGRALGWGSFWAMVVAVVLFWIRWFLESSEFDLSNGIVGLQVALYFLWGTMVVSSHILVFVCDHLTGGDAGPSAWALAIFWGGVLVCPVVVSVLMFL